MIPNKRFYVKALEIVKRFNVEELCESVDLQKSEKFVAERINTDGFKILVGCLNDYTNLLQKELIKCEDFGAVILDDVEYQVSFGNIGQVSQFCSYLKARVAEDCVWMSVTAEGELDELKVFKENYFKGSIVLRTLTDDDDDDDEEDDDGEVQKKSAGEDQDDEEVEGDNVDTRANILSSVLKQYYFINSESN